MSNIRFYIPKDITIPTDLLLYVDDTYVEYKRIQHGFQFWIAESDRQKAMDIAKEIAEQMIIEHDESQHGVTWETVSMEVVELDPRYCTGTTINWIYRVRDSY